MKRYFYSLLFATISMFAHVDANAQLMNLLSTLSKVQTAAASATATPSANRGGLLMMLIADKLMSGQKAKTKAQQQTQPEEALEVATAASAANAAASATQSIEAVKLEDVPATTPEAKEPGDASAINSQVVKAEEVAASTEQDVQKAIASAGADLEQKSSLLGVVKAVAAVAGAKAPGVGGLIPAGDVRPNMIDTATAASRDPAFRAKVSAMSAGAPSNAGGLWGIASALVGLGK